MQNLRNYCRAVEKLQAALAGVLMPHGEEGASASGSRAFIITLGTSLLVISLLFACYVQGALSGGGFLQVAAVVVAVVTGFYVVFRTGLNRAAADPSLTLHQMVVATLVVMYAMYSASGGGAGVFPIIVVMIFLVGVLRMRTGQLLLFALFVLAAHAAMIAVRAYFRPQEPDLDVGLLQWTTLAVTLPWFALMGGYIKRLREELGKSNASLRTTLKAVQASEARLGEAQRIAGLGSWTFDPATKVTHWSPETYRIFGVDPADPAPLADAVLRHVHPEDQLHYFELIRPAIYEGRAFDSEYRIVSPNGEIRWVHVIGEPVVDGIGQTILLRGTVVDITERRAYERAISRAKDEAAAARTTLIDAIDGLPEAFALFDAADRLALCNGKYAEAFTDFTRFEDIAGMTFEGIVRASISKGAPMSPEFANDIDAWVADRVSRHRNPNPEPREVRLGGGRWLLVTERRTSLGGIVGIRIDITERKQLEQRQAMGHAVTRVLAESEAVGEAMPKVIRIICEALEWDCGARWQLDAKDNLLHCFETWTVAASEVAEFSTFSARQTFAPGSSGLICRVMTTRAPVWIADVAHEPGFKRASAAANAGLHGALAFPIRIGSEPFGAIELLIRNVRQPDTALLRVLDSIGLQIGQFIARMGAQEQLRRLAHYDFLTGLPNRTLFNELLLHAFAGARRNGTRLAILFVDLDGFKEVNDRHGHDAGDHLLATFSDRLKRCLRESDTIARHGALDVAARLGGDEFVVLIDHAVKPSGLATLATRILEAAAKPFDLAGPQARVTASIGISIYPEDSEDIEGLIKAADGAMYDAKQDGRNAFRFHSTGTSQLAAPNTSRTHARVRRDDDHAASDAT